jgi:hypothetical protein
MLTLPQVGGVAYSAMMQLAYHEGFGRHSRKPHHPWKTSTSGVDWELTCSSLLERTRCSTNAQVGLRCDASGYHHTYVGAHRRRTLHPQLARNERSLAKIFHLVPHLPASCAQHRNQYHTFVCVWSRHCESRKVSCQRHEISGHRMLTYDIQPCYHLLQTVTMVSLR